MTAQEKSWVIGKDGVGAVAIGQPLPEELRGQTLEAAYAVRYIGDAQPLEGFRFEAPPLLAVIAGGPFAAKVEAEGPQEPAAEPYRADAAKAARGGAKVKAVMVHGAGPKTAAGVGVGSALTALEGAYADLKLSPVPSALGDDECVATTASLPGVRFLFSSCDRAKAGAPVVRVDVWPEGD